MSLILRELAAKLGLDVDAQSFAKGALAVEAVKLGLSKLVAVANEAVAQFVENVKATAEHAETLDGLAQSAGVSTAALQRMGKAAATEGMGIEDLAKSLVLLDRSVVAVKGGNEEAAGAFHKLGVKVTDAHGKIRPTEELFLDMADGFSKLEDGAEKTALSMKIFGKSGAEMIQVINNGREALSKAMSSPIMTDEQIAAGKEMVQVQRALTAQTKSLWRSAVAPLLPAITELLKRYLEWKRENAEIMRQRIQAVLGAAIKAVRLLGDAFVFVLRIVKLAKDNFKVLAYTLGPILAGVALKAAYEAMASLTLSMIKAGAVAVWTAAKTAAAWALAAAPFVAIGAVVSALLLIFDDLRVYEKGGKSLFGLWKNAIADWLKPNAQDPWWLAAIKQLVAKMAEAMGYAKALGLAGGETKPRNPAIPDAAKDLAAGRKPFVGIQGGPVQWEDEDPNAWTARALRRFGVTDPKWVGRGPWNEAMTTPAPLSVPARPGAGTVLAPTFKADINFNGPADAATVGPVVREQLDQWWEERWNGKMESAAGAVTGD